MRQRLMLPSTAAIRAQLVQERLVQHSQVRGRLPRVVATGQTGAGKSTLGNTLLGAGHVLDSTGSIDCTDRVHRVRFRHGLEYVDLPGVASDEAYENYNRVALGLPQVRTWPQVTELTVVSHTPGGGRSESSYPPARVPAAELRPDVVLYLIAPHRTFGYSDAGYLTDLLKVHPLERILFVLNLFEDAANTGIATRQNIEDIIGTLNKVCHDVGQELRQDRVVRVCCRSGAGIPELIEAVAGIVPAAQRAPLTDVLRHQQVHTPGRWLAGLNGELTRFLAAFAAEVPADADSAVHTLTGYREDLAAALAAAAPWRRDDGAGPYTSDFTAIATSVVHELRREHTEPILESEEVPVAYEDVPIWATRKEKDYDNPKYEQEEVWENQWVEESPELDELFEGIGNWFDRGNFAVRRKRRVFVGYRNKIVGYHKRKVDYVAGYDRRVTQTETVTREVGRRVVAVTFEPYGRRGAVLLLAACLVEADELAGRHTQAELTDWYDLVDELLDETLDTTAVLADADIARTIALAVGLTPASSATAM